MNSYYVYILTNWKGNVMYIGVTNNLERRLYEHKNELVEGFTKKYHVHKLVYFEETSDVRAAIEREKQLKNWSRGKKNALVETMNPQWEDAMATVYMIPSLLLFLHGEEYLVEGIANSGSVKG